MACGAGATRMVTTRAHQRHTHLDIVAAKSFLLDILLWVVWHPEVPIVMRETMPGHVGPSCKLSQSTLALEFFLLPVLPQPVAAMDQSFGRSL